MTRPICWRLFWQTTVCAAIRALLKAGSNIEIRIAMIPITTRSSTSVKPRREFAESPTGVAEQDVERRTCITPTSSHSGRHNERTTSYVKYNRQGRTCNNFFGYLQGI